MPKKAIAWRCFRKSKAYGNIKNSLLKNNHHKFFAQLVLIKEKGAELDRVEALRVLREILRTLQEQTAITSVSLDEIPPSGNCSIKNRSSFNECSRGQIHSVLDKHHLTMEENVDSIVVYSP